MIYFLGVRTDGQMDRQTDRHGFGILILNRDGQNHHMLMILKSKSNHLNKGDLKSNPNNFISGDLKIKITLKFK